MREIIIALVSLNLKFCFIGFCNYWSSSLIHNELRTLHVFWHLASVSCIGIARQRCLSAIQFVHVRHTSKSPLRILCIMLRQLSITPCDLSLLLFNQAAQVIIVPLCTNLVALIVFQYCPLLFIPITHLLHPFLFNLSLNCLLMLLRWHVAWICCWPNSLSWALSVHLEVLYWLSFFK